LKVKLWLVSDEGSQLPVASLRRRYVAGAIDAASTVGVLIAAALVGFALRKRLPWPAARLQTRFGLEPPEDGEERKPFELTKPQLLALMTFTSVLSVWGRNLRGPGARIMRLRRVEARTGGAIQIRTAIVRNVADAVWRWAINQMFKPLENRSRETREAFSAELSELSQQHADNPEALHQAIAGLHGVRKVPFKSCLWLIPWSAATEFPRLWSPDRLSVGDQLAGITIIDER
jgi:hypothetical protein